MTKFKLIGFCSTYEGGRKSVWIVQCEDGRKLVCTASECDGKRPNDAPCARLAPIAMCNAINPITGKIKDLADAALMKFEYA